MLRQSHKWKENKIVGDVVPVGIGGEERCGRGSCTDPGERLFRLINERPDLYLYALSFVYTTIGNLFRNKVER